MGRHSADPVEQTGTFGRHGVPPPATETDPDAPVLMLPESVRASFRPVRPVSPVDPINTVGPVDSFGPASALLATNGQHNSNGRPASPAPPPVPPLPAPPLPARSRPDPGPAVHLPYIAPPPGPPPGPPPAPVSFPPAAASMPVPTAPAPVGTSRSILVTGAPPAPPSTPPVQVVVARPLPREEDAPTTDRAQLGYSSAAATDLPTLYRPAVPTAPVRAPRLPPPPTRRSAPPRLPPPPPLAALPAPAPVESPYRPTTSAPDTTADVLTPRPLLESYPSVPVRPPPTPPTAAPASRRPVARAVLSWLSVVVVAVLVAVGLRVFIVESFWIPSASMEPTLHGCQGCNNDHVLVNKASYDLHPIHRGDVVVFDKPASVEDNDKYLIKRVIGVPGDAVSGHDGKVWIGNRPLTEPYVNPACGAEVPFAPRIVPKSQIFVMGDNRCDSFDSRMFGFVAESAVVGRAFLIVWPVARRHWL